MQLHARFAVTASGRASGRRQACVKPVAAQKQDKAERDVATKAAAVAEPELKLTSSGKIKLPKGSNDPRPAPVPTADVKQPAKDNSVLFQGFGWSSCESKDKGGKTWYAVVKEKIPELKASGITHLWLPPPSQSVAPQGYLPGQLYNLHSSYGSPTEVKELCTALKEAGICPMADIVINHRCADVQDENGVWNKFSQDENPRNGTPIDWGQWAITGDDPEFGGRGNKDTGEDYGPAPDLDHTNEGLRQGIVDWMLWLKEEIGFTNWRFDFVKGYGANFITQYCGDTVGNELFNVGEYWADLSYGDGLEHNQNGPRQVLCDWLDKAGGCTLFDFPTKGILAEAVANTQYWRLRDQEGKPPGLLGWWPSRAVTFVDNHDTGSTQRHWPFPQGKEETGYAYILSHPGIPCILWEHYFDDGKKEVIDKLIALRQRSGVNARSKVEIWSADGDYYTAKIDDKLFVKLGPRYDMGDQVPKESEGWKMAASGVEFAIWEKS